MSMAVAVCEDLKEALIAHARDRSLQINLPIDQSRPWAACLFRGSRHSFVLVAHDEDRVRAWLDALPVASIALKRGRVADISVAWSEAACGTTIACIDVLTITH